ncbi:hypothetical protein BC828DRAFT_377549 [Blastocladiella britannica]|nr:hypothetical protein BC828DRAFT_377549 [Blastocladiella britannica]
MLLAARRLFVTSLSTRTFSSTSSAMGRLAGQTVFITGASAGIGASCARQFAAESSNLVLTARRVDRLTSLRDELLAAHPTIKVHVAALDVTHRDAVAQVVADLPADVASIDVLVNNAGLSLGMDTLLDAKPEDVDGMLDTNVKGLINVTQAVVPGMKTRGRGTVINIGSVAGRQPYAGGSVYCASKAAVDAIGRAMTQELLATPLRVCTIAPGAVNTEFSTIRFKGDADKAAAVYKGIQPLTADDIAEIVVFTAGRPAHVQINDILVFPTAQSSVFHIHRE